MAIDDTKFLSLCSSGTLEEVKAALNEGANPNAKDIECITALMKAAHCNWDSRIITALLEAGADIHARSIYRMTALDWAEGITKTDGKITLSQSARDKRLSILKSAILSMNEIDDDIFTVLCRYADSDEVISALRKGADINARDIYGQSVLMDASRDEKKLWLAELMLREGADVNLRDNDGQTALMYSAYVCKSPAMIHVLVHAGADVNARDNDGVTALMISAKHSAPGTITALLDAGAEINARDNSRRTAIFYAAENESSEPARIITERLTKAGKNIQTIRDSEGKTVLMYAAERSANPEIIRIFIDAGSDVNAKDKDGTTALMLAAAKNIRPEILYSLIDAGADVNAQNSAGNTALILAARNHFYHAILEGKLRIKSQNLKILLDAGADPAMKNSAGLTFADYLRKS